MSGYLLNVLLVWVFFHLVSSLKLIINTDGLYRDAEWDDYLLLIGEFAVILTLLWESSND